MRWTTENRARVERLHLGCDMHAANEPLDYRERWEWSKQMYKTHLCVQCPQCGLWKVWLPREMFE
jgi:hypothetical protein